MQIVFIGLGSNLGDRKRYLTHALEFLPPHILVDAISSIYESAPMYIEDQPRYLNAVVRGRTTLAPHDLLALLKKIERDMGRSEDSHNQPRPIDLDILLYADRVIETPDLTIPHPKMHERPFVLVPLAEIAPLHYHPRMGKVIADLEDELAVAPGDLEFFDQL